MVETINDFNTNKYLDFYSTDAILDDSSIGRKFRGHEEIRDYFESYFIGYNIKTKIVLLKISDKNQAHLEVEFTGSLSEGIIGGTFDFSFKNDMIKFLKADLLN